MSILSWLKGAICKLFDTNELAAKMQTLPADKDMTEAVRLWAECYRCTPPWAVADSNVRCLNLPYSVAHEMARLVTLELNSELTGSPRRIIFPMRTVMRWRCLPCGWNTPVLWAGCS